MQAWVNLEPSILSKNVKDDKAYIKEVTETQITSVLKLNSSRMELPHIGDQCAEKSCRQLDFLPVKCDGCKQKFCGQHWTYQGHDCPSPRLKDVQVPVCPLCDKPVPSKPGAVPDEAVSIHLDRDCKSGKQRTPRCSKAKCKVRELIKVDCGQCGQNFCLKHRHPQVLVF